jgi:ABC-type phosphate transport system permease subunit
MEMQMIRCKKKLAILWFVVSGLLFFVVLFQSYFDYYGENMSKVWEWLLPTMMPTLSLMLGVFVMDTVNRGMEIKKVDRFFFRLTLGISSIYLTVVALTILVIPFVIVKTQDMVVFYQKSHLFLGPLQGLASASLGAFFVKKEQS